jgi:hypothetical protein
MESTYPPTAQLSNRILSQDVLDGQIVVDEGHAVVEFLVRRLLIEAPRVR